jgi:hypothetical protein
MVPQMNRTARPWHQGTNSVGAGLVLALSWAPTMGAPTAPLFVTLDLIRDVGATGGRPLVVAQMREKALLPYTDSLPRMAKWTLFLVTTLATGVGMNCHM